MPMVIGLVAGLLVDRGWGHRGCCEGSWVGWVRHYYWRQFADTSFSNGYVGVVVGVMGMEWVGWIGWILGVLGIIN